MSSKSDNISFIKTRFIFWWLLLFYLAFTSLYGLIQEFVPSFPSFEDPIVMQILYSCSFISLCFYLGQKLHKSQISLRYIVGNLHPHYRWLSLLGLAIIFIIFSMGAALISFQALSMLAPEFHQSLLKSVSEQETEVSAIPIIHQVWQTINYVLIAPVTEEFIFRGVLLHRLALKWNLAIAIWVSSIIFGLLHPNPIGIAAVGFAWALLYIKTKSLVVPIIAHGMNNAIVVIGEFATDFLDSSNTSSAEMSGDEWIAGIFFLAISLPFILHFIYRRFPQKNQILPYFANQAQMIAEE